MDSGAVSQAQRDWAARRERAMVGGTLEEYRSLVSAWLEAPHQPHIAWNAALTNEDCLRADLGAAARCGRADIVAWLADDRAVPLDDEVASQAARSGHVPTFDAVAARWNPAALPPRLLVSAAISGRVAMCERIAELIAATDAILTTALKDAAYWGHSDVVAWLIDHGAEPAPSALWLAVERAHAATVRVLLDHGADPRTQHLLGVAVEHGNPEIVALIAAGADLEERMGPSQEWGGGEFSSYVRAEIGGGDTPYLRAVRWGREDLADILLAAGANPDAVSSDGETAAMLREARSRSRG